MSEKTFNNIDILSRIGDVFRQRRIELRFSQKDLSNLSGLTTNTISAIENGAGTSLDNFFTICRALKLQPQDVLPKNLELTPLYNLPPESQKKLELTVRLEKLIKESDFFDRPKRVSEVLDALKLNRSISNRFSVYLTGYCRDGLLEYTKTGKVKYYKRKN